MASYIFGKGKKSGGLADFVDLGHKPLSISAQAQLAAARKKGHSHSFWDNIKDAGLGTVHGVEWTFDKILRPAYGVAAGSMAIAKDPKLHSQFGHFSFHNLLNAPRAFADFGHGFKRGFTGKEKHGFGNVLEAQGLLKGHRHLRGIAGFGLDVGLDPLTYVSGGTTMVAGSTGHALAIAGGRRALADAAEHQIAKGAISHEDAIAQLTKDVDHLTKAGKDYRYRRALAKINLRYLKADEAGKAVPAEYAVRKRVIAAAAHAEEKRVETFVPHYKIFGHKITPDVIGRSEKIGGRAFAEGRRVVPKLPKLDNLIAREGIGSGAARKFREAFIRASTETPETHAMAITTKHISERITDEQFKMASAGLHGIAAKISPERQRQALHYFEKPAKGEKAIIKSGGVHVVNPRYAQKLVAAGKITEDEADFVDRYQKVMEQLFHNEKAHGAVTEHFSKTGRMYVPHLMDRNGVALNDEMRLLTTKAGFERARSDREFSLKELVDMADKGDLPRSVIKDPYELLVSRLRASGRRQAELNQLDAMATIGGVKTRLVDTDKLAKHRQKIDNTFLAYAMKADEHTAAVKGAIDAHEKAIADAEARIRSIKHGRNSRTKAANLRRAENQLAQLRKSGPVLADAAERFTELKGLQKELLELGKVEKKILKGKKNPEYNVSMHTVGDLKDAYGHPIALPDELGQAALKVRRVIEGDDAAIKGFEAGYRKMLSRWKVLVTSINPGYRMRNSQTDLWNWWLKPGVNTYYMAKNLGKAVKFMKTMKNIQARIEKEGLTKETAQALRDFEQMYDNGVLSGLFQGDVQTAAEMLRLGHSKKALLKKARLIKFGEKAAQDMNRNGENWVRIAHFFWARDDKELSAAEAALSVKSAHFDYEDLTPFEQRRMKAIAPFYTWTRKNIPYQIRSIIQSPGKYAAFPKAAMEADYAADEKPGTIIPDYITKAWGVPLGGGNYVLPQLGVSDLQTFDNGKQGFIDRAESLGTPAVKLPIELMMNKNLFTGGPIASDTHSRNPVSPFGAALLRFVPGANVGATSRIGPGGERVYGPGANPYLLHALGYLGPTANLLLNKTGGIKRTQMGPVSPLWSYGAGISVQHVDQAQQQLLNQIALSDEAKKILQDMRDEGLIPQAKRRHGRQTDYVNSLIAQELGRR